MRQGQINARARERSGAPVLLFEQKRNHPFAQEPRLVTAVMPAPVAGRPITVLPFMLAEFAQIVVNQEADAAAGGSMEPVRSTQNARGQAQIQDVVGTVIDIQMMADGGKGRPEIVKRR